MIEKILSFEELNINEINLRNTELKKIFEDLKKIGFFSEEKGKEGTSCMKIYNILRKYPEVSDKLNGGNYIREDYLENGKAIHSKVYGFNLDVLSTCS